MAGLFLSISCCEVHGMCFRAGPGALCSSTCTSRLAASDIRPSRSRVRTSKRNRPSGRPENETESAEVNSLQASAGP